MEKEKMIEEMAHIMNEPCTKDTCDKCKEARLKCEEYHLCKRLYDAGYRKVPEGAVVLTKEELAEKYVMKEMYDLANACHDEKCAEFNLLSYKYHKLEVQLEQASKKTAREILDEVSKHYGGGWLVELYKKYGVEVE